MSDTEKIFEDVAKMTVPKPEIDMTDDPEYEAWVESMAKHCRCRSSDVPCAGVLAGGLCDEIDDRADDWEYDDNELP